jgi:hypothetical protein
MLNMILDSIGPVFFVLALGSLTPEFSTKTA